MKVIQDLVQIDAQKKQEEQLDDEREFQAIQNDAKMDEEIQFKEKLIQKMK